jgi:hypothetical protein
MMTGSVDAASFRELVRGIADDSPRQRDTSANNVGMLLDWKMLDDDQTGVLATLLTWSLHAEGDARAQESILGALSALSARRRVSAALLTRIISWLTERDLSSDDAELLVDFAENVQQLPAGERQQPARPPVIGRPVGPERLRQLTRGLLSESRSERERCAITVEVCRQHSNEFDVDEAALLTTILAWAVLAADLRGTRSDYLRQLALLSTDGLVPRCVLSVLLPRIADQGLDALESTFLDTLINTSSADPVNGATCRGGKP